MANRTGNYAAFYVKSPFKETNLGANTVKDFVYYRMLRMWKGNDSSFPFIDSHDKNYNVRDDSDWESTLKPRLRDRLSKSKNIILFLSNDTKNSTALKEEIDYGINEKGLPVIIIYPDYSEKTDIVTSDNNIKKQIKDLWDKLPILKSSKGNVPILHIPLKKSLIKDALSDSDFKVSTKTEVGDYFYSL